jgi:hypothetical protein
MTGLSPVPMDLRRQPTHQISKPLNILPSGFAHYLLDVFAEQEEATTH